MNNQALNALIQQSAADNPKMQWIAQLMKQQQEQAAQSSSAK